MTRWTRAAAVLVAGLLLIAAPAHAGILEGVQEVVAGVLQIPISTIGGTFTGPPLIGTLFGVATGLVNGAGLITHGALNIAFGALGIAKTVAPFVLPFVF